MTALADRRLRRSAARRLGLAAALLGAALPAQGAAGGSGDCAAEILGFWRDREPVPATYPLRCYDRAIEEAPEDALLYGDFTEVVLAAKRAATRQQRQPTAEPASPTPAPPPATEPPPAAAPPPAEDPTPPAGEPSPSPQPVPAGPAPTPPPAPGPSPAPAPLTPPLAVPPAPSPPVAAPPAPAPASPAPTAAPVATGLRRERGVPLALELLFGLSLLGTLIGAAALYRYQQGRSGLPPPPD